MKFSADGCGRGKRFYRFFTGHGLRAWNKPIENGKDFHRLLTCLLYSS